MRLHTRGVRTLKESLHWKLTLERKSLSALGNWTCISGMTVQCSNQLSYSPSLLVPFFWYKCCWAISKCRYICAQTYTDMHTCMLEITVDLLAVWFTCVDPSSCIDFFSMSACIGLVFLQMTVSLWKRKRQKLAWLRYTTCSALLSNGTLCSMLIFSLDLYLLFFFTIIWRHLSG